MRVIEHFETHKTILSRNLNFSLMRGIGAGNHMQYKKKCNKQGLSCYFSSLSRTSAIPFTLIPLVMCHLAVQTDLEGDKVTQW